MAALFGFSAMVMADNLVQNGEFEKLDKKGRPVGWTSSISKGGTIKAAAAADVISGIIFDLDRQFARVGKVVGGGNGQLVVVFAVAFGTEFFVADKFDCFISSGNSRLQG